MSSEISIRKIGNSSGLILPKELMESLGVKEGDTLFLTKTPNGIELSAYDPDFAKVLLSNRDYMQRHKNALRELAK